MNRNSVIDYLGYILFRLFGPIIRSLPKGSVLFLGHRLGDLFYYFDLKHKSIAYANLKTAFGTESSPSRLSGLTKDFYRTFGQNLIEIFMVPLINKQYINKYISIEGLDYITEGFKRGKGVILLGAHEGSWELSNIICANLGFPFVLFVRDQRYPRINQLLNSYRRQKGCKIIQRKNETAQRVTQFKGLSAEGQNEFYGMRQLIQALKNNVAIGMTIDQGGKTGILVKFFGKDASMPQGAIKLALKYDAWLIPVFYTRVKGPQIRVLIAPHFKIKRTGDLEKDIRDNLQEVVHIFEKYITTYPKEYLWTYKIWKYADERDILILSDSKAGHLRQAQSVANIVSDYFKEKDIKTRLTTVEVKFKGKFSKPALTLSSCLSGKYHCQGCLWCLETFLREDVYDTLISIKADVVISCGSSVAPVNYVLSRENLAKSIVVMRPSFLSMRRFNLVIVPWHDNPIKRKNVVVTEGALNLIDDDYLREQSEKLIQASGFKLQASDFRLQASGFYIGLLVGGDTKHFKLRKGTILEVIKQIKSASEKLDAGILITTSRRTSREVEKLIKEEFKDYAGCKLLIIANEENIPEAVGGILGLSQIIITSPESISMISEAVESRKYVLVFQSKGLGIRHKRFLEYFVQNKYIYLAAPGELSETIEDIWLNRPQVHTLKDNLLISEAIKKIL